MKITFEGQSLYEIFDQMKYVLQVDQRIAALTPTVSADAAVAIALKARSAEKEPGGKPVDKLVDKPVEKRARTEKQKVNDEKLRVAAKAKQAARAAARAPVVQAVEPEPVEEAPDPFVAEPEIDPAEMVKMREKTFEELRTAYANGHQNEVMELLSRFGNGAKTFRELPPESFMPIRKAIDLGALE